MAKIILKMDTHNKHDIKMKTSGTGDETSLMIATLICNLSKSNGFPYQMLLAYIGNKCEEINSEI